ncbi:MULTISPECIES: hypothetical protein [unclassified Helicobacter]|nr:MULTISPECIES: hypothetical protein [unclassified Helicobacter]
MKILGDSLPNFAFWQILLSPDSAFAPNFACGRFCFLTGGF